MIDYLVSVSIGVLSSFVASLIFLLFLTRVRPKIEISDKIAKSVSPTGEPIYRIKIINKTRRSIINVKAELQLVTPTVTPGGIIQKTKTIPLKRSEIMEISKFDLKDKTAGYAFRFVIYENLEELWKDETRSFLRFRVYAVDSLSGFGRVFVKEYHTKRNSIKEGDFEFGNSLEIK